MGKQQRLRIVEGISGYWHYHLADGEGWPGKALCGANHNADQPRSQPVGKDGWG